jgi:hypothetical protein
VGPGRGKKAVGDTNSFSGKRSNTRAYSLARLKRDHPELADKVINSWVEVGPGTKPGPREASDY